MPANAASSDTHTLTHLGELQDAFVDSGDSILEERAVPTRVQFQQVVVSQTQRHLPSDLRRRRRHLTGFMASLVIQVVLVVKVSAVVHIRISLERKTNTQADLHHHRSVNNQAESVDNSAHVFGDEVERDGWNPSERQERVGGVVHLHGPHSANMKNGYFPGRRHINTP